MSFILISFTAQTIYITNMPNNPKLIGNVLGATALLAGTMPLIAHAEEQNPRPNVIFILTDDQGYGDMSCHGNPNIKTPAIDRLHSESVCFDNFHSGTTSAPTRAGIITGHYCNSTGVWHTIMGRSVLSLEETTLSEIFKFSGYNTAMFGKWHLGDNYPYRPNDRGFDMAFYHGGGGIGQTPDYWENCYFDDTYFRNGVPEKTTGFSTDVLFNEAIKYIDTQKDKKEPFFCFLSTPAPHFPFNVEDKYFNLYKDNPDVVNAAFYGMISNLDENLARLDKYIKDKKLDKNTIVIFMTDNGSDRGAELDKDNHVMRGYNAGMRGMKGSVYEGGHRVAFMMRAPGTKPYKTNVLSSYVDFVPTMIDMCSLTLPKEVEFHGTSLRPIVEGGRIATRYIFNDTQRGEHLVYAKPGCVMSDRWRLINGKELYDITVDGGQRNDISAQYPDTVAVMRKAYAKWWDMTNKRANTIEYIPLGDSNAKVVVLNGHDTHDNLHRGTPWNQEYVRIAVRTNGFWSVDFKETGKYLFEIYRYAPEAHLPLLGTAPQGKEVPNGKPYPEGVALTDIKRGIIRINGKKIAQKDINSSSTDEAIKIVADIKNGECNLEANFEDNEGEFCSYYVKVTRLD